ncbi:MAG TPA: hypothetical protein VFZ44_15260 [Pyrinomonadaceae bacterium]
MQHREYTPYFIALVLLWELAFPLAVFSRRARAVILSLGVAFHLGTLVLMNIFFLYHLALYVVFLDLPAPAHRLGKKIFDGRARSCRI